MQTGYLICYRSDPDAGLHAATEWLLLQWGQSKKLAALDKELQQSEELLTATKEKKRQWYINGQGQTFVILEAGEFLMGSTDSENGQNPSEQLHKRRIDRQFAICTKEVTRAQWRVFAKSLTGKVYSADEDEPKPTIHNDDSPMIAMTWYEAAHYCNWSSEQELIPKEQWCYEPSDEGVYGPGMKAKEKFWELTGYRLLTESEWEFACRAGASCSRYYGVTETLLPRYAWYLDNSDSRIQLVARLKPNDFGLFDMQGNVYEWCSGGYPRYPAFSDEALLDWPSTESDKELGRQALRGGAFSTPALNVRSAYRYAFLPDLRNNSAGFRPARTYNLSR